MLRSVIASGVAAFFVAALPLTSAGEKNSASKVKVSATASKLEAGKQTVTVTILIDKGWHIYQNPVGNKLFEPNRTVLKVLSGGKVVEAKIDYPKGVREDDYFIYRDKATIAAQVTRAAGDAGPLTVEVVISACSDGEDMVCLERAAAKAKVTEP